MDLLFFHPGVVHLPIAPAALMPLPDWHSGLILVKPQTVIGWHRRGFKLYWSWKSRNRGGRPPIDAQIRTLIRRIAGENPTWGAPRIHGELLKLGFEVAEATVSRYMPLRRKPPSQPRAR